MSSAIHTSSGNGARSITRRTVSAGAAWAVPVIAMAAAAPAMATSQCVVTTNFDDLTVGTRPTMLTFLPSSVTAVVTYTSTGNGGDDTPGDTGLVAATSTSPSWNYLEIEMLEPLTTNDSVTVTITFSAPVENLTFKLHDIDGLANQWRDTVRIDTAGFTSVRGANIIGTGVTGDPFRNQTEVDNPIETGVADVTLTWAGPVDAVTFTYLAGISGSSDNQHIGLGDISFTDCVANPGSDHRLQLRAAGATPLPDDLAELSAEPYGTVDR
ncbi:MAG TPA: hypothetical protein VLA55_04760 [Ornithinibacter sp.]|nr:hypothetical protein [Ornithinibacter sp.]